MTYDDLDDFTTGFIEAMLFTECSPAYDSDVWFTDEVQEAIAEGTSDGCLPGDVGEDDIEAGSLAFISEFCAKFQRDNAADLALAYERDYDDMQAGRDLWFTSQGHGVGFWDRDELEDGGLGDRLSTSARYNEMYVWFGAHVDFGNAPLIHVN